ncbi:hypothetical protein T4B_5637 [Trichinella pseudospiralis]|uniref:Uncharacterized protein n=1 Tax=Trichinella pseudospiralis TaxID=6337 RepID=A0A0V1JNQ8_TRIPS|nr:hypothetical protein T4A_11558 [Trichinella pseudospiralis]KRZ22451.1 hypothetical protein T4B_5637 [Trichinella pseudospiralis]KRZ36611.1 hypothetical protein T4C_906 [Trichinella pseudospiralis]
MLHKLCNLIPRLPVLAIISFQLQLNLVKSNLEFGKNPEELSKVGNYAEQFGFYFVVPALATDLQFRLVWSDLCCFCENMTESLSPNLRQLSCEQ